MVNGIWQEFLKIVQQEVGSQMVETWLKAVSLERWDARERVVYLITPNSFVKDWLRSKYVPLFELHLKRLFNVEQVSIVFIDGQVKKPSDTAQPQSPAAPELLYTPARLVPEKPKKEEERRYNQLTHINSGYNFHSFVVGPSNQLAYAAACAVSEKPGRVYNPLFMCGPSGLGKTHLLHAIGNEIKAKNKGATVLYQTADRFVNEFVNAIRFDRAHQFQIKYKDIDVLLIDDVQFMSNKDQTQDAFFHIFNSLHDAHKQIVFSSDTYPQNIDGIAERLRSRLAWGLVTDIQMPTIETKVSILKKKAALSGIDLHDEIALFLASALFPNVRVLEGALVHILAVASLTNQTLTLDLAKRVVARTTIEKTRETAVSLEQVARVICDQYAISLDDLRSQNRSKEVARVRHIAMYLMKKMTHKSLQEIGFFLGRKDHTTIINGVKRIQENMKKSTDLTTQLVDLEQRICS